MAPPKTGFASRQIARYFDRANRKVYSPGQLLHLWREQRNLWGPPFSFSAYVKFLLERTHLRLVNLRSPRYPPIARYVWRGSSPHEIALSLRPRAYLSHGTALFLHGLSSSPPKVIYVNQEQSAKNNVGRLLTQDAIHSAMSREPRVSQYLYRYGHKKILLLGGKHTARLGVKTIRRQSGEVLEVTCLERTLIDISVRPFYAGGVHRVLTAFRAAKTRLSSSELFRMLTKLEYVYPYHQVIGFYMERAGFSEDAYHPFLQLPIHFDFYLMYGLTDPQYDHRWRLHYPANL